MKRKYFTSAVVLALVLLCSAAVAFQPSEWAESSGPQTGDATVLTGEGFFRQIIVTPDGTNDVTVAFYDNTAASGDKFLQDMTFAGNGGTQATPPVWIPVNNGITIDVTLAAGTVAYTVLRRGR